MNMLDKVQTTHLARQAIIYPRQSTIKQLCEHKESTIRQYQLVERAIELGWDKQKIVVIDEDLGQSGASTEWRHGFQRLAEGVAHGKVGGVFALEVSRLARSSADWHRLLELCSLADVLILEEQAVYNPCDYNDRLLLGLKGTMSEAELYWMRLRLQGGRISKARRGELYFCPPAGYEWDRASLRFRFDASEEVRRAIRTVFERFRLDGSAYEVSRYMERMGLALPSRGIRNRNISWVPPRHGAIISILHNPIYAGAYAFGRKEERMGLADGKVKQRCTKHLAQDEWKSLIFDRHPAYISWEEFLANQKKLYENSTKKISDGNRGAAREGRALLQGLVLCGRCGRRMYVHYQGKNQRVQYICRQKDLTINPSCWEIVGEAIEKAVVKLFLDAIKPSQIELAIAIAKETEEQLQSIDRQWDLRKERLQYEASLAERRYKAVEPENRVVARTLEQEWEEKLGEIEKAAQDYEEIKKREKLVLTKEDKISIAALAKDLPSIWNSATTTIAEKKNLLRTLIREITLTPIDGANLMTQIKVWWHTGSVSELLIPRRDRYTALATPEPVVEIVRNSYKKNSDKEIADKLNKSRVPRCINMPWDGSAVRRIRYAEGLMRPQKTSKHTENRDSDGLYSKYGVAEVLGVSPGVVNSWSLCGLLPAVKGGKTTKARWFCLDKGTLLRLEAAKAKRLRQ